VEIGGIRWYAERKEPVRLSKLNLEAATNWSDESPSRHGAVGAFVRDLRDAMTFILDAELIDMYTIKITRVMASLVK
jgi:hypothetical protein